MLLSWNIHVMDKAWNNNLKYMIQFTCLPTFELRNGQHVSNTL